MLDGPAPGHADRREERLFLVREDVASARRRARSTSATMAGPSAGSADRLGPDDRHGGAPGRARRGIARQGRRRARLARSSRDGRARRWPVPSPRKADSSASVVSRWSSSTATRRWTEFEPTSIDAPTPVGTRRRQDQAPDAGARGVRGCRCGRTGGSRGRARAWPSRRSSTSRRSSRGLGGGGLGLGGRRRRSAWRVAAALGLRGRRRPRLGRRGGLAPAPSSPRLPRSGSTSVASATRGAAAGFGRRLRRLPLAGGLRPQATASLTIAIDPSPVSLATLRGTRGRPACERLSTALPPLPACAAAS